MNPLWVVLIVVLVLVYIVSPVDILPDIFPVLGWLDDTFLVGLLAYYLRYRRMPKFIMNIFRLFFQNKTGSSGYRAGSGSGSGFKSGAGKGSGHQQKGENTRTSEEDAAPKNPYEILGVSPNASPEEIRAAYREAAQRYHPDKVAHLGQEFRDLAQKKFVEIQQAYTTLMQKQA